jgi:predicted nucleic acid-binding protein
LTTVVADANVIVQACISSAGLAPLSPHELLTPPIGRSEALSSLREMRYRGEISAELARIALERLVSAPWRVREPDGLLRSAWHIAGTLGWAKTYDAEYVVLAQLLDCPLLTLDARLQRGAGHLVHIVGPTELAG